MITINGKNYPDISNLPKNIKPPPVERTDGRSPRAPGAGNLLDDYLKAEWEEFEAALAEKVGDLKLNTRMENQLRRQFGFVDKSEQNASKTVGDRLQEIFPSSDSMSVDATTPAAGEFKAEPMTREDAAARLEAKSGTYSCMDELTWVIYSAGGFKAGNGYGSADNEKKLSTRPVFTQETEMARKDYVAKAGKGPNEVDLRHIISSTTLNKALANSADTVEDINAFLKKHVKDYDPKHTVPDAAKLEVFNLVHSHMGNLWAGGAADNQAAGTMHGKLNADARKQARLTTPAGTPTVPDVPVTTTAADANVSDCKVNRFLVAVAKIDEKAAKDLNGRIASGDVDTMASANAIAKQTSALNDQIRSKIGKGAYTASAMKADLEDWLRKNPAIGDGSEEAKVCDELRRLCEAEVGELSTVANAEEARVDECLLTTYLENLRPRGEVSAAERKLLDTLKVEEAVTRPRQQSQKAMVTACVDYLQARSIACDLGRDTGGAGYTQQDLVGDLENLAANFDFDLPDPIVPGMEIESITKDYAEKLIQVELALLDAKSKEGVKLFESKNEQPRRCLRK